MPGVLFKSSNELISGSPSFPASNRKVVTREKLKKGGEGVEGGELVRKFNTYSGMTTSIGHGMGESSSIREIGRKTE